MQKYLHHISGSIQNTNKSVEISLQGKNLIITGANGSGKTSFLRSIYHKIDLLILQRKQADLPKLEQDYVTNINYLENNAKKGTTQYEDFKRITADQKVRIDAIKQGLQLHIPENIKFSDALHSRTAIIRFFDAARVAKIAHADTARGLITEQELYAKKTLEENIGNSLEQHLVNLRNRRSLALTEDNNPILAEKISEWFLRFESNLKLLMEDDSAKLSFDSDRLKFYINQQGKSPYTFQLLSSGYSAIFDIYADILLRTEYFKVTPEELGGIVFIDEIDAHLHVSLQRLILPFFERSFPCVQFVVTTHSPFVLMSVNDALIFDLGRNQQVDEDLSLYSYAAVMEGILGTKTTSKLLDETLVEIASLAKKPDSDPKELKQLLEKIRPFEEKLDSKSKAYYMLGVNALLDKESD